MEKYRQWKKYRYWEKVDGGKKNINIWKKNRDGEK